MQTLRYAFRQMSRSPLFSATAVLVLALGIGANSAMFGLVNALIFRPLAVLHPEALVGVYSRDAKPEGKYRAFSYPNYADIRAGNTVFSEVAAFNMAMAGLQEGDLTRRAFVTVVSDNYFRVFGIQPVLGRDFLPDECRPRSGAQVAIVAHAWWQRHGGDAGILGQTLKLNGKVFTVVGVAPEFFTGTTAIFAPDLWVPLGAYEQVANDFMGRRDAGLQDRANHQLLLVGRLAPGISPASAGARLEPVARRLAEAHPAENRDHALEVSRLPRLAISTRPQDETHLRALAVLLLSMSGVVLLVACMNMANMLLARGAGRRREMAVRLALGGGRSRILRQLLVEGLVLSGMGGGLGLALAWAVPRILATSLSGRLPGLTLVVDAGPDGRVLVFTMAASVVATLLFGLMPAWRLTRTDLVADLKDRGGDGAGGRVRTGLWASRNLLVAAQVAFSLALLTSAFLFMRGARNAARANPGFAFDDSLLVEVDASLGGIPEAEGRRLYGEILNRVRSLPGVANASWASVVPFGMFYDSRGVRPVGGFGPNALKSAAGSGDSGGAGLRLASSDDSTGPVSAGERVEAGFVITGRDYFRTVGLSVLKGRDFDRLEEAGGGGSPVAIIDEMLARRLWGDADPIGRQLELVESRGEGKPGSFEVIGVVTSVRQELGDREVNARFYVPVGQHYQGWMNLHVRLAQPGPEAAVGLMRVIREEIRKLDDRVPVLSVQTLRSFHEGSVVLWGYRMAVRVFGAFAGLALVLSVIGIYGVRAYLVTCRTREIGIRMALGAARGDVVGDLLREGLCLAGLGMGAGLVLALLAGRLLANTLYEVGWADPTSLGISVLLLGATVVVACWIPARRAATIDPIQALRQD